MRVTSCSSVCVCALCSRAPVVALPLCRVPCVYMRLCLYVCVLLFLFLLCVRSPAMLLLGLGR